MRNSQHFCFYNLLIVCDISRTNLYLYFGWESESVRGLMLADLEPLDGRIIRRHSTLRRDSNPKSIQFSEC